jgi:phosphatidylglycerol:prolipoprotein diacylglycerol transferase
VNQEAHGTQILDPAWQWFPAGVQIFENGQLVWYMATFFYESIWNLIVFAVLMLLKKKIKVRGGIFALYGILYGFGRFFIESLRTDSLMLGHLRISQIVSIALIAGGILFLIFMPRRQKQLPAYDGFYSLSWTPEQLEAYKAENSMKNHKKKDSKDNGDEDKN